MRTREWIWIGLAIVAAWMYFDRDAIRDELVIQEALAEMNGPQIAKALADCMNGGVITVANKPVAKCERTK